MWHEILGRCIIINDANCIYIPWIEHTHHMHIYIILYIFICLCAYGLWAYVCVCTHESAPANVCVCVRDARLPFYLSFLVRPVQLVAEHCVPVLLRRQGLLQLPEITGTADETKVSDRMLSTSYMTTIRVVRR